MNITFEQFTKGLKKYSEFARLLNRQDNQIKSIISEEYFRRFFKSSSFITNAIGVYNTNSKESKKLIHRFPELKKLGVGYPNCPLVDLIVDYGADYSLVSCKWYSSGLDLKEIGMFMALTNDHYPNLRDKYIITNAPRMSAVAERIVSTGKNTIKIFEEEFDLEDDVFQQIIKPEFGHTSKKLVRSRWNWRNKKEQQSYVFLGKKIKKNSKSKYQGPPGVGKTHLMFKLDKYFYKLHGGLSLVFADGIIILKQNFDHFNEQYQAHEISRPSLVICKGVEDDQLKVDWPVEVMGRDPVKIALWIKKNPNGIIFCYYGNTLSLEQAVKATNTKFTCGWFDEASRTCQPIGSGWSHAVHDHLIPIKYRGFFDATHRSHRKFGMNLSSLYGEMGFSISQPEAEKSGSVSEYYIKGLIFKNKKIQTLFHARKYIKGKNYTVEDKVMITKLAEEYEKDVLLDHVLCFALTIKRCKSLAMCFNDVILELKKTNPNNKKIQKLCNIKAYVADTHLDTTRDIRDNLDSLYESETRSLVFTSRLLYRGWNNVKLDGILFADNFKSISYIVQALGRGLRRNINKPNKICKVMIPVDMNHKQPYNILLGVLNSLKKYDFRPIESIIGLATNPRSKKTRRPNSGSVVLNTSGIKISSNMIRKGLNAVLINDTNWLNWNHWHDIARLYIGKLEMYGEYFKQGSRGSPVNGFYLNLIYNEIVANDNYKKIIEAQFKNLKSAPKFRMLFHKIRTGTAGIKLAVLEHTKFFMEYDDIRLKNGTDLDNIIFNLYKKFMMLRSNHPWARPGNSNSYTKKYHAEVKEFLHQEILPCLQKHFPKRTEKKWLTIVLHDWANGYLGKANTNNKLLFEEARKIKIEIENIRKNKIANIVEIGSKVAWEIHVEKKIAVLNLQRFAFQHLGFPNELKKGYWQKWITNPNTVFLNQYNKRLIKNRTNPIFSAAELLCSTCKTQKVKKNIHATIGWYNKCPSCLTQQNRAKRAARKSRNPK